MKNKYLHLIAALLVSSSSMVWAQPKADGAPALLVKSEQAKLAPQWSPDGKKIALTTFSNDGIWIVDANGKNLSQVTSDKGSGYKFSWSKDNKTILARPSSLENKRMMYEVKTYNVSTRAEKTIVTKTRNLEGLPSWNADNSEIQFRVSKQTKSAASGLKVNTLKSDKSVDATLLERIAAEPATVSTGVANLSKLAGKVLFNATQSQVNGKIAFQAGGKLYVCEADGSQLKEIGNGERASWTPNGKYVIVSLVKDDGKKITEGKLNAVDVVTGQYTSLETGLVALSPSVSPDGTKLAFEDYASGNIYVMGIKY